MCLIAWTGRSPSHAGGLKCRVVQKAAGSHPPTAKLPGPEDDQQASEYPRSQAHMDDRMPVTSDTRGRLQSDTALDPGRSPRLPRATSSKGASTCMSAAISSGPG